MSGFLKRIFGRRPDPEPPQVAVIGGLYKLIGNTDNPFKPPPVYALVMNRRGGWVSYRYKYLDNPEITAITDDSMLEAYFMAIYSRRA